MRVRAALMNMAHAHPAVKVGGRSGAAAIRAAASSPPAPVCVIWFRVQLVLNAVLESKVQATPHALASAFLNAHLQHLGLQAPRLLLRQHCLACCPAQPP